MHNHDCRYCKESFMCGEDRADCFRRDICCDECFWKIEVKHFALVFILAVAAIGMTLFVFGEYR